MLGMWGLLGGVLLWMTLYAPTIGPIIYTAWALIGLETVIYWTLCYSNPGIPQKILQRARDISDGNPINHEESNSEVGVNI